MKFFGSCLLCVTTASVLVACSPAKITHQFEFSASYGAEPLRCGAGPNATSMTDLRWFIHDALLVDSAGRPVPLQLVPDGIWQSAEVALID
ncbi:MAG: hypothetical protein HKP32_10905, partial [Woeseia sp.]|nr:hypothetical protein [Woeseia sp.]